jgi:hypothetical protein
VLLTAAIFLVVNAATGRFRIEGDSMEPNLHNGEYVLIDKISYLRICRSARRCRRCLRRPTTSAITSSASLACLVIPWK